GGRVLHHLQPHGAAPRPRPAPGHRAADFPRFAGRVPRLHGPHLRGVLADTRVPRALTRTPGPGGIRPGLGYVPVTRTTDSPALELRSVTKRYGDVTAVD